MLDKLVRENPGKTIYCYHQIVHNTHVVKGFEKRGAKFVDNLEEVPKGGILVFSSHGISPSIKLQASNFQLQVFDVTCPFVLKTHLEIKKYAESGIKIIYLGQKGHDEAAGAVGEAAESCTLISSVDEIPNLPYQPKDKIALITQTTLSLDETKEIKKALKKKFKYLMEPKVSDICTATQERQNAVSEIVKKGAETVVVLGSKNSSNSNKLKMVAQKAGAKAYLIDEISELEEEILENIDCIGLTAGASVPEAKTTEAINWFKKHSFKLISCRA